MTDTNFRWLTCAHCAGVVNLVCDGDISVKDGIARLVLSLQAGTPEQRRSAVSALQFLAYNSDPGIARAAQHALHDASCVAVSSVLPAAAKAVDGRDDTEDASSVKGSALKRPVSSMMKTPSLSSNSKDKSAEGMPKGWTNELVGPIVIWSSPNGKKFRSWA